MGSFRHPKVFDPTTLESIRDTFHDIVRELEEQEVLLVGGSDQRLKATIVEQLLELVTDGTPPD